MRGLFLKLIVTPIGLLALSGIFPSQIHYPHTALLVLLGLVIAFVGHGMEVLLLRRHTIWLSTFLDFAAVALIMYFSQFLMQGAYITVFGILATGLVIASIEHFQHIYFVTVRKNL